MIRAAVGLLAGALTLGGCTGSGDATRPANSTSSASPTESPRDEHLHQMQPDSATAAQLDPVVSAEKFLRTWARPELPYEQWWADLEPLLNPQGKQSYSYTDPAEVPALKILGTPDLEPAQVETSAVVWFTTDQGKFAVRLARTSGQSPWLVARLYFPGSSPTEL